MFDSASLEWHISGAGRIMFDHISRFISNDECLFQTQITVWISPSIVFLTSLQVIDLGSGTIPPTIVLHLTNL
jgi:hypothetical protein